MLKSEYACNQVKDQIDRHGTVKIVDLIDLVWLLTDDGDPRWIAVALLRLNQAGAIRYLTCDDNHNHNAGCTVEAVR